jgi:hypothetical protein
MSLLSKIRMVTRLTHKSAFIIMHASPDTVVVVRLDKRVSHRKAALIKLFSFEGDSFIYGLLCPLSNFSRNLNCLTVSILDSLSLSLSSSHAFLITFPATCVSECVLVYFQSAYSLGKSSPFSFDDDNKKSTFVTHLRIKADFLMLVYDSLSQSDQNEETMDCFECLERFQYKQYSIHNIIEGRFAEWGGEWDSKIQSPTLDDFLISTKKVLLYKNLLEFGIPSDVFLFWVVLSSSTFYSLLHLFLPWS